MKRYVLKIYLNEILCLYYKKDIESLVYAFFYCQFAQIYSSGGMFICLYSQMLNRCLVCWRSLIGLVVKVNSNCWHAFSVLLGAYGEDKIKDT